MQNIDGIILTIRYNHNEKGRLNLSIQKKLKDEFPSLVGDLKIQVINKTVFVSGNVSVEGANKAIFKDSLLSLVYESHPGKLVAFDVKVDEFSVVEDEVDTNKAKHENALDEVNVLYYGMLSVNHIKTNDKFKVIHENNRDRLDNCVKVLEFISPIILDSDLKVIDGNFRLQLAKDNGIKDVMVVVIDDNDKRADFLRLALNRTAEFQRWNYRDVDDYVDSTPQAQPILEPIGFFGRHVLPESYFSNTVVNYIIDPFNEKQKQYSQEEGLAEWAKYRREQMAKLSEEKRAKKPKKANAISLFDLSPKKEDFLETYDIDEEMDEFVEKYKKIAGEITDHVDAIKKKGIEENGGVWQNTHRTSAEVAQDKRLEAIELVQESQELTDEEKEMMIANIEEYAGMKNLNEMIKKMRGE